MNADVVVIGAGFGGLGAALRLAERGARVVVLEALRYPGGCAGTYTRFGARFDAGATLVVGVQEGQLFRTWLQRWGVPLAVEPLDPVLTQVVDGQALPLPPSREGWRQVLVGAGAPPGPVDRFLATQAAVGPPAFALLQRPEDLPPRLGAARALPRLLPALPLLGRSLGQVLDRCGLTHPLARRLLDGLCQITVQVPAAEADAVFALGALEVFFAGAAHVTGGVGALADGLVTAIHKAGGEVRFAHRATGLAPAPGGYTVTTTRGPLTARQVVANVLPRDLITLLGRDTPRLRALAARVDGSYGAAVLYRQLRPDGLPARPFHRQLIGDGPTDGRSAWVSVGDAFDPSGLRPLVASTHLPADAPPDVVAAVQQRLRDRLRELAPDLDAATAHEWTASPRTFARFTRRGQGLVGGVPRRPSLRALTELWPRAELPGLWLVGDSVLYGQSTLSVAVGGHRVADAAWGG